MNSLTYVQSPEMFEKRIADQLRNRKADTAQFFGDEELIRRWVSCSSQSQMVNVRPIELDHQRRVSIVDLGPGTGIPCTKISEGWNVQDVIAVDVSVPMLEYAMQEIRKKFAVQGVVADFYRDSIDVEREAVWLCIGNNIGNYNQKEILMKLASDMKGDDRIIIGVRLYSGEEKIKALADFFASKANNVFGTYFLRNMGASEGRNYSVCEDDPHEENVKIIRVFHEFDDDTLKVNDEELHFAKGDTIQYLESREYDFASIPSMLGNYGLEVIQSSTHGNQGFYLCKKQ